MMILVDKVFLIGRLAKTKGPVDSDFNTVEDKRYDIRLGTGPIRFYPAFNVIIATGNLS